MCGVAGFVTTRPASGSVVHLGRMTEALRHRGPDDFGFYHDEWAHLGHRRLSIVDLAGGHQPMANPANTLSITYNGELYNHSELRPALERAGHRFHTRSDTETILEAYAEHGAGCLRLFRGMFAFGIWDRERRLLFCARDRLGIKPLYYFWNGELFAFASEIKALLQHPEISAALDEDVLPEVLAFGYSSSDRTLFRQIRKLMPGHSLKLDLMRPKPEIESYWDIPSANPLSARSDGQWVDELGERLEECVGMHRMSDVPLGVFLSGGLDSSVIAALVKKSASGPVKTFAVGYGDARYSELSWAAQAARAIGTDHRETVIDIENFFSALPRLIWHEDEPIAWPSSVSLYFVSKLAASEVKVVLTGEGSDELFAGYERYRWQRLNLACGSAWHLAPGFLRRRMRRAIETSSLLGPSLRRKLGHTALARDPTLESMHLENFYCAFSQAELSRLSMHPSGAIHDDYLRYFHTPAEGSMLARTLFADQKTYLVELLMKQDQMSMACSIESRVPFLDHTLVEFAARVPERLKIRHGEQKYILKEAAAGLLPRRIIHRKKQGFPTPLRSWLREAQAEPVYAALQSPDGILASYLDRAEIDALVIRHRTGNEDATDRIWRLLNLQLWGDLFLTGRRNPWWNGVDTQDAASTAV